MSDHILGLLMTQTWQIAALAIAIAVVVKLAAKNRPHLAHALWVLVLIKCATPPLWGHSLGVFSQLQARLTPVESASLSDRRDGTVSVPIAMAETLIPAPEIDMADPKYGQPETFESDELRSLAAMESPANARLIWDGGIGIELDMSVQLPDELGGNTSAVSTLPLKRVESDASWLHPRWLLLSGLVAGAMMTFFIMVIRCLRCLREIHRRRTTEFDEPLRERIQQLSRQLRIRRIPQIIVSDVLFGPAVLGLLRHTIVLPRCLFEKMASDVLYAVPSPPSSGEKVADRPDEGVDRELSTFNDQLSFLDPILAHELLHIRRGDLHTGTLQAIVQSLWWFHPAVWLSNRWLSREAERCCDEQVIAELGCSPARYARSLLSVIECKHQLQPIPVFPGMKPVEITTHRMERIMSLRNGLKKKTPLWCWLTVVALALVVLPGAVATPSVDEVAPKETNGVTEPREKNDVGTEVPEFDGNLFWSDTDLRKHLSKRERTEDIESTSTLDADCESIKLKYLEVGFFDVEVKAPTSSVDNLTNHTVRFEVKEGSRYAVREVRFEGNNRISASDLQQGSILKPGDKYRAVEISREIQRIRELYKGLNLEPTTINPVPHFSEEIGVVDLVFKIDEGLKALIRLDESFIPSPEMVLTGDTVLAYVGEKAITVSDVVGNLPEALKEDSYLTQEARQRVLLARVEGGLPLYLYNKAVIADFEEHVPKTRREAIIASFESPFADLLEKMCRDRKLTNVRELEHELEAEGFLTEKMRESFERQQIIVGYTNSLGVDSPVRNKNAIHQYCRQRLFEARLRAKVSLSFDEAELKKAVQFIEDTYQIRIVGNYLELPTGVTVQIQNEPLLSAIKAIVEPNGFQVVIGDEEVVITVKAKDQPVVETLEPASIRVYAVADLVVFQQPVIAAVSRTPENENQATQAVLPASAKAVASNESSDKSEPMPQSETQKPTPATNYKADFAPLTELIKATVQPESWEKGLAIQVEEKTLSLIIQQTEKAHQEIAELLSQLRNAQDQNVRIQCTIFQLADGVQSKWLEEQVSLHALRNGTRWALLSQQRSETFARSLRERKPGVLSAPQVMTISGQTATIQIGSAVVGEKDVTGIRLEMTPHLLPDSKVIRMQHSFLIGDFASEMPQPVESLVGSGQTLLLVIDDPEDKEKPDAARSQFLLMMTPEHMQIEEEDVSVATPKDSASAVNPTDSPDK